MVRNAASMQNLRDSMSDFNIASPSRTLYQQSSAASSSSQPSQAAEAQRLPSARPDAEPFAQLCGTDDYTKWLMNRVATGEATPSEQQAFAEHVRRSIPAGPKPQAPQPTSTGTPTSHAQMQHQGFPPQVYTREMLQTQSQHHPHSNVAKQQAQLQVQQRAHMQAQMQLNMRLEEEQRRRLQAARLSAVNNQNQAPSQESQEETLSKRFEQNRVLLQAARMAAVNNQEPAEPQEELLRKLEQQDWDRLPGPGSLAMHDLAQVLAQPNVQSTTRQYIPQSINEARKAEAATHAKRATRANAEKYTKPFCDFLTDNPTVFHAVDAVKQQLKGSGFTELNERDSWDIKPSGKYFVERNGSALIAFTVGDNYKAGNGAAILAGHVDALTAKLKPVSQVPNKAGYLQLGIAPYAGAPNNTWWDRDLGIGGRVLMKEGDKIVTRLVKLDWPIARIPTLAPHFGAAAIGPFNPETQMTPIIGLEGTEARNVEGQDDFSQPSLLGTTEGKVGTFISTQPPRLVKAIANALGTKAYNNIVNWELELFDIQPATVGGLDKEFIFAGRIDDKLCSWAAVQALVESDTSDSSIIKTVGLFDDEEIGSLLRQGARGNFLPSTLERAVGSLNGSINSELIGRTYANSFMVSSDVIHAVNPNFLNAYLENHSPHLNVGLVVSADSNGHMTTDSVSTAILQRCADKVGAKLQVFQIRNDSRSGGTVGPMLSSATGIRAIDAGIPQLSMHSIRATTGSLDPGLGVLAFRGFLDNYESVDKEFS